MSDAHRGAQGQAAAAHFRIHAGWLIDGSGGPVLTDAVMEVRGDRIAAVQPQTPLPDGAILKDFSRATVLPPLMDVHVHLALSGSVDPGLRKAQLTSGAQDIRQAVDRHLGDHRRCGVSAVRDGGDRHGTVLQAVRAGTRHPVTVRAAGWAWHARGRYGGTIGRDVPQEMGLRHAVSGHLVAIDHVKIIHSGLNSLDRFGHNGAPQFTLEDLAETVRLAHAQGKPVMAHANGAEAVRSAIAAGCDSIEHGYFMGRDNLRRLADHDCVWVPTAIPMAALVALQDLTPARQDVARRTLDHQLEQIAFARHIGVRIGLGTDAGSIGVMHGKAVFRELALLVRAGLSIEQAIQSATGIAARLMRLPDQGSLTPGLRADVMIVSGPPERLLQHPPVIAAICLGGRWCDDKDHHGSFA